MEWLGAVQSQDYSGAKWALAQRSGFPDNAVLDAAFNAGNFLRTHVMRPTWHFVAPADIRWMQDLTASRVKILMSRYDERFGVNEYIHAESEKAIVKALKGGKELTRTEIHHALQAAGITVNNLGLGHVTARAELNAIICSGARKGKQQTYALVQDRVPPTKRLTRDQALTALVVRYFTSHGPALVQDFAWWSGLTVADTKRGLELAGNQLEHADVNDKPYWFAPFTTIPTFQEPLIHLLPNYDEYLIAYKDRSLFFDPTLFTQNKRSLARAFYGHIIVLTGRVIGGWRRIIGRSAVTIETDLLVAISSSETKALHAAAERYGAFLGLPVKIAARVV